MNEKENRLPDYIEYPFDRFIKLRVEFLILSQSELEAKIMRIIEWCVETERNRLYLAASHQTPKGQKVTIPEEVWVAIPKRFFLEWLYGTVQSENTFNDALNSVIEKHLVFRRESSKGGRYDAMEYTLNKPLIVKLFELFPPTIDDVNMTSVMKKPRKQKGSEDSGGQFLIPSEINPLVKDLRDAIIDPLNSQFLTPSNSKIDPLPVLGEGQFLTPNKDSKETLNKTKKEESVGSHEPNTPPLTDLEKAIALLSQNGYSITPLAEHDAHHQGSEHTTHAVSTDQGQDAASVPTFQLTLTGELTPGYALAHPLIVNVARQRDGMWIVSEGRYAHFAVERTQSEAIAAFKSTLVDECIHLGRGEANLAPHLLEELAYLRTLITHQQPVILPPQPVENAPVASISSNDTGASEITPQREKEALVTRTQPSYSRNNATPAIPTATNEVAKPVKLEKPTPPPDTSPWPSPETAVQIVEARIGQKYREKARERQLSFAKRMFAEDPQLTRQQFEAAYDKRDDAWWHEHKGRLHLHNMVEKDRVHEMLDKIDVEQERQRAMQEKREAIARQALPKAVGQTNTTATPPQPDWRDKIAQDDGTSEAWRKNWERSGKKRRIPLNLGGEH